MDPNHENTIIFFDDFEIDPNLVKRTRSTSIFYSTDDEVGVLKSVEIIKEKIENIRIRKFHNYGHFCIDDMKTHKFPELLKEILK